MFILKFAFYIFVTVLLKVEPQLSEAQLIECSVI